MTKAIMHGRARDRKLEACGSVADAGIMIERRSSLQRDFFDEMADPTDLRLLFEHLPGVHFFMKDAQSRMVMASRQILERLGVATEVEVIGRTDHDFFPQAIADNFVKDDQQVLQTGEPIVNRVEIWYNSQRVLDWFTTTKLPVRGRDGSVIGVMGLVRSYEGQRRAMAPFSSLAKAVEFIREHSDRSVVASELARVCHADAAAGGE